MERRLDLRHAFGRGGGGIRLQRARRLDGHDSELGPGRSGGELDLEPGREPALVRPDPGHGRAGIARDHWRQSRAGPGQPCGRAQFYAFRMRTASAAAFRALSTPTAATGTPGGIWAMARRASRPSRTLRLERSGTPITGRSVCAATTPGSAADSPAPQLSTLSPRPRAPRAYSATAPGVRWAERTSNS